MDAMAEIRETFFIECEELLEALEADLIAMSEGCADTETVNAVFRAVHSIKGGAGAFALDDLVRFAHKFETTLDEVRAGRLEPDADTMNLFLRGGDMLADLVRAARDGEEADGTAIDAMLIELVALTGNTTSGAEPVVADQPAAEEFEFQPLALAFDFDDDENKNSNVVVFAITFRPYKSLYENGNETALLFRALADLGEFESVCDTSSVPNFDEIDHHGSYLTWEITLRTEVTIDAVREVFDFVEGACDLDITPAASTSSVVETAVQLDMSGGDDDVHENIVPIADEISTIAPNQDEEKQNASNVKKDETPKPSAAAAGPKPTVRVDLERVDRLINLVGELVINQSMLSQCLEESESTPSGAVLSGLDEFKQLTRDIQESVMAIRAQPVKPLFQRMSRIVREASNATGKDVRLVFEGDATEIDKTVVERLADPLTHMIRNAVDHGLESTEKRLAAGKLAQGNVYLTAAHRSGRVVIEVRDDGGGINRDGVKAKAIEKGIISPDAELTNAEIDGLLFMPGFSTASAVSDLSGRGVGMDVVKRAIQSLGGRITITSEPGVGTTFSISLPLTLAVLDGMVVRVADQTLIVPLTAILETFRPSAEDIHEMGDGARVVFLRGKYVPIIDTGHILNYRNYVTEYADSVMLLVETDGGTICALAVDGIQDQRQVVIKGLEDNYGHVDGIAAATILGDGRIALILDADALIENNNTPAILQSSISGVTGVAHV